MFWYFYWIWNHVPVAQASSSSQLSFMSCICCISLLSDTRDSQLSNDIIPKDFILGYERLMSTNSIQTHVSMMFSEQIRFNQIRAVKTRQITCLALSRPTVRSPVSWARLKLLFSVRSLRDHMLKLIFPCLCRHTPPKKDKQMVNRWVQCPLWTALRVYSGDGTVCGGAQSLQASLLPLCLACSILGYVSYMSKQDVESSQVMIPRASSLQLTTLFA